MIKFRFCFLLSILLIYSNSLSSQTHLTGYVYSAVDSSALPGVSVYFDGTSTGVSTTDEGYFSISLTDKTTSKLVVSYIGHETLYIPRHIQQATPSIIVYLKESEESLGEVFLETDPWSRKKKLNIFRNEFLGRSQAALECIIKNEDALKLTYIPSKEIMIASATEPLSIVNQHLGYKVTYELKDFVIEFRTGFLTTRIPHKIFYEGTSFFKELKKNTPVNIHRNREKAYNGSTLEFMRSLAGRTLEENNYSILRNNFEMRPYAPFLLSKENGLTKVQLKLENVNILYRETIQSSLQTFGAFFIDKLGNHMPPQNVVISGKMGQRRFAKTLPLNYSPERK